MDDRIKNLTTDYYNQHANDLAKYFAGFGSRSKDINEAFSYFSPDKIKILNVLEIGCGDGRDAKEIVKITDHYTGIDISQGMLAIARQALPNKTFITANVVSYKFGINLDIIFAFASLLHCDKIVVSKILNKAHRSLNPGGIFFISLKKDQYHYEVKTDEFGSRLFFFYQPADIEELAGPNFKILKVFNYRIGHTDWFNITLQTTKLR